MKKLAYLILLLALPILAPAQEAKKDAAPAAPKKNTISTYRIFAKDGHDAALKAALAAHAQKFHTGSWKWRVSDVLTGPDMGSYQITEGPNSWTDLEGRGDLGPEHTKDYDTNLLPHIEKSTPESYLTYQEELSTTAASNWSTKVVITHIYYKPGRGPATFAAIKTYKAVWEKLGYNFVVWSSFASGEPQYVVGRRLKNGFKDFDDNSPAMRQAYDDVNGAGSYDRVQDETARDVSHSVGEMIEFKPELSSK